MIKIMVGGAGGRMGRLLVQAILEAPDLELAAATGEGSQVGQDAGLLACGTPTGVIIQSTRDENSWDSTLKDVQIMVEFSLAAGFRAHLAGAVRNRIPLVSGTTGLTGRDRELLGEAALEIPAVWSPNMAPGANIMMYLAGQATARFGPDVEAEITEIHHRHKIDAPSGTAAKLAQIVQKALAAPPPTGGDSMAGEPAEIIYGRQGDTGPRPKNQIGVHSLRYGDAIGEHTLHLSGAGELITITHRATDRKMFVQGALRAVRWLKDKPAGLYGMESVLGLD